MYDSDVSDEEWDMIKHYFDPADNRGGARKKHAKRELVNAIFYLNKTGAQAPAAEGVSALENGL